MDAATGLLYVGNGQYYDPATGRFLTRDAKPNQINPYVPWNPLGAIFAPLAVLSMFYSRKRKRSKWDTMVIILLLGITAGMGVVACGPVPPVTPVPSSDTAPSNPSPDPNQTPGPDTIPFIPTGTATPPIILTLPDCPTATLTPAPAAPAPSSACTVDCYDAYLTYDAVVNQLGRIPSIEEVLYMTADTEYTAYADDRGVRELGREGIARSFYEECDTDGCQGDELYKFLAGYQPWIGYAGQPSNEPTTPTSRAQKLVTALGSNKDWLWLDVRQITDIEGYAEPLGWTKGLWTGRPSQWFGPFTPDRDCRKNVTPLKIVDTGNSTEFWILPPEEIVDYKAFCK